MKSSRIATLYIAPSHSGATKYLVTGSQWRQNLTLSSSFDADSKSLASIRL